MLNLSDKVCNAIVSCIFSVILISPDFAISTVNTRPLELNVIVYLCLTKAFEDTMHLVAAIPLSIILSVPENNSSSAPQQLKTPINV